MAPVPSRVERLSYTWWSSMSFRKLRGSYEHVKSDIAARHKTIPEPWRRVGSCSSGAPVMMAMKLMMIVTRVMVTTANLYHPES